MARIADRLGPTPGKTIDPNGRKVTYPDIKLVYVAGANLPPPPDTNNLVKAWRKPQTVIVHEPHGPPPPSTPTSLPATTSYERNDRRWGRLPQRYVFRCTSASPSLKPATTSTFQRHRRQAGRAGQYTEGRDAVASTDVRR